MTMNERRRFLQVMGGTAAAYGIGCGAVNGVGSTGGAGGAGAGGSGTGTTTSTGTTTGTGAGGKCGGGGASSDGMNNDRCSSDAGVFALGAPSDYAADGLHTVTNTPSNVLVGRDSGGLYAMSSLCTHQCCDLNSSFSGQITSTGVHCLCHGSKYDLEGAVTAGPATEALTHHELQLGCDGVLYVDTTKNVPTTTRLAT
jgi:cytochrome b6-f complex iron-sulfur subunit